MQNDFKIGELAEKTGVTKRTIHYYVNRGLIPNPIGIGVNSFYTDEHLIKILLIKKFQEAQFLPLEEISKKIVGVPLSEAKSLLEELNLNQLSIKPSSTFSNEVNNASGQLIGTQYIRVALGLGLELHVPSEMLSKKEGVINSIVDYTKKLLGEQ